MVCIQISFCYYKTMVSAFLVRVNPWLCIELCNRMASITYYKQVLQTDYRQQTTLKSNCFIDKLTECLSIAYSKNSLLVIALVTVLVMAVIACPKYRYFARFYPYILHPQSILVATLQSTSCLRTIQSQINELDKALKLWPKILLFSSIN